MMRINVSGLMKSSLGSQRNHRVSEAVSIADGDSLVEGAVTLIRTNRSILVRASLKTEAQVTCSRCLNTFVQPLLLKFEEEYFPVTDVVSGGVLPLPEEPGCFTIDDKHILDLTEAVRQYVLLAIPMKPLCREDCAGLCPVCGRNLSEGSCDCRVGVVDPRWAALSKLVTNKNS